MQSCLVLMVGNVMQTCLTLQLFSLQSKFEFQLRLQEFIELVRAENNLRAITYARKYLAPWGTTHMKELQRVMATLAFKSSTDCATYKVNYVLIPYQAACNHEWPSSTLAVLLMFPLSFFDVKASFDYCMRPIDCRLDDVSSMWWLQ